MFDASAIVIDDLADVLTPDEADRVRIVEALNYWLAFTVRKKPLPDLEQRMEDLKPKIKDMVDSITFEREDSTLVVKVDPNHQATWSMLEFGTLWFEPHPNLVAEVINAYMT